jgi:AcrR family transcriptional regulator
VSTFVVTKATLQRLGKREQTKVRNRAVILAAARKVFGTLGYDRAAVRDIVRATGLSVGTFYEYFRDKQEIFAAVAEEAWAGIRQRLRAVRRDRRLPLEERVRRAYLAYFQFVVEQGHLYSVLDEMILGSRGERGPGTVAQAVEELREDLLPDWASGALGAEDPDLVATAMVGTGLLVARQMRSRGRLDPEEAARFCTRFTLGGLKPAAKFSTSASTSRIAERRRSA